MKRFYLTFAMVMTIAVASFAQLIPQGTTVPFTGIKRNTANVAKDNVLVTPPADAVIEDDWAISGTYYYGENIPFVNDNPISVAFHGNDVYFKGVVLSCPNAWIKGRLGEDYASFPTGQYCGKYGEYSIYACGTSDAQTPNDIMWVYDPLNKKFTISNIYVESAAPDLSVYLLYSYTLEVYKDKQVETPTDLTATADVNTALVSWTSDANTFNLRYRKYVDMSGSDRLWDFEDNEQLSDFTFVDADGDGRGWTWGNSQMKAHSGSGVMYSASYDNSAGALTPDNWIITPKVKLGGQVSFWACSQETHANYANEKFQVYVYEGDEWTSTDDFVAISDIYTTTVDYQQIVADLSEYEGYGYIAIRHFNCTDQFWLNIDDLEVTVPNATQGEQYEWTMLEEVSNPYTIRNLEPETEYEVQVCGVTDGVASLWTQSAIFTTLPEGGTVPTIDELYLVGSFNGWDWQNEAGRLPFELENDVFTVVINFEDGDEFKLITPDETSTNGWRWFGGLDENNVGYFEINDNLLDQPIELIDGANFKIDKGGKYIITVTQLTTADGKAVAEPLVMTVSKEATGISTIAADRTDSRIFDLQGRELKSVPEHGIYIQGGKKHVK